MRNLGLTLLAWTLMLGSTIAAVSAANAESLSARELKRIVRQADKALDDGRVDEAVSLYRQILDGTDVGNPVRVDALEAVALADVAADPGAGRAILDELTAESPTAAQRPGVAATRALLDSLDTTRAERDATAAKVSELELAAADRQAEVVSSADANFAKLEELREEMATVEAERDALGRQLAEARATLEAKDAELAKKDEAIEKLKAAVIGN